MTTAAATAHAVGSTLPATMQAVAIREPGGPDVLELVQQPVPAPGAGEVLIRVAASGINRPDVVQRKGHYPAPPATPLPCRPQACSWGRRFAPCWQAAVMRSTAWRPWRIACLCRRA